MGTLRLRYIASIGIVLGGFLSAENMLHLLQSLLSFHTVDCGRERLEARVPQDMT
jgi:hypothetical protein